MTTTYARRQELLRLLEQEPGIKVTQMADRLEVSEGTIRNDLDALEAEQKLRRVRGGAVLSKTSSLSMWSEKIENERSKRRIARWAAELVDDKDTIWLDPGTTAQMMVPFLIDRKGLTIVTNGLRVATQLVESTQHTVLLIGGKVGSEGIYAVGPDENEFIAQLQFGTAFVSSVGFTLEVGLSVNDYGHARLNEQVVSVAERVVALVDSSKFGKRGLAPFAEISRISHIVTDSDISDEFLVTLQNAGVNVTICDQNTIHSHRVHRNNNEYTIGFANQSEELSFAVAVRRGLERAVATRSNTDLVIVDNKLSGEEALRVADYLIGSEVDLAIEYQIDYRTGNLLMEKFKQANIPVIAVDIPMVGATFFGVDNYRCGLDAGIAMGEWVSDNWNGEFDYLFVLEEQRAGSLPAARIQGQLDGISEVLGTLPTENIRYLDSGNTASISEIAIYEEMTAHPDAHRIAIAPFNADATLGALKAARRLNRESDIVIVGQGADRTLIEELKNPHGPLIGAIAFMPESYGEKLIEIALKILNGVSVPPAVYTEHSFITKASID
jgi:ribose transport system substrate-binding protein